jgi:hypothetical protein
MRVFMTIDRVTSRYSSLIQLIRFIPIRESPKFVDLSRMRVEALWNCQDMGSFLLLF